MRYVIAEERASIRQQKQLHMEMESDLSTKQKALEELRSKYVNHHSGVNEELIALRTPLTQHACTIQPPMMEKTAGELFKTSQLMRESIQQMKRATTHETIRFDTSSLVSSQRKFNADEFIKNLKGSSKLPVSDFNAYLMHEKENLLRKNDFGLDQSQLRSRYGDPTGSYMSDRIGASPYNQLKSSSSGSGSLHFMSKFNPDEGKLDVKNLD